MASEWNQAEDLRAGAKLLRQQPELTPRGAVWTQVVWFEWQGARAYTQLTIRDCSSGVKCGHGRIWPMTPDEDGA